MKDDFFLGWNKIDNNTDFSNYHLKKIGVLNLMYIF